MPEKKTSTTRKKIAAADEKKLRITQVASGCGRKPGQQATLVGLGLNKIGKHVERTATPEVLGMVNKVKHLLKVEELG